MTIVNLRYNIAAHGTLDPLWPRIECTRCSLAHLACAACSMRTPGHKPSARLLRLVYLYMTAPCTTAAGAAIQACPDEVQLHSCCLIRLRAMVNAPVNLQQLLHDGFCSTKLTVPAA